MQSSRLASSNLTGILRLSRIICLMLGIMLLTGCGAGNNLIFDLTPGACPNGNLNDPYCMSVQIQNNFGGQNWINSTNFPITDISVNVSGADNVLTPTTNNTLMDPNNCTGSTLNPGSECTFYLQLIGESYAVGDVENMQVTLNYTVNNALFGQSTTTGSSNFTAYEIPSLYVMQNNGTLWMYNGAWMDWGLIESYDATNSIALDTNAYGLLYLGGNNGIYTFGVNNTGLCQWVACASISSANYGANTLLTSSSNLYAINTQGVWSYSLAGESWSNGSSPLYSFSPQSLISNVGAVSPSAVVYLATPAHSLYACSSVGGSNNCQPEGSTGISGTVSSLAFVSGIDTPYTGLYAATNNGLFIETGSTPSSSATWESINTSVGFSSLTISNSGTLYAGDNNGNIWQINSTAPTTMNSVVNSPLAVPITSMVLDNFANTLYFTAGNPTAGYTVYSCDLNNPPCTPTTVIASSYLNVTPVVGMAIGSELTDTTSSPGAL